MRIRLSNTQARVMRDVEFRGIPGTNTSHMHAVAMKGATVATFKRLHTLGLITEPRAGAPITERGLSVWASGTSDTTARSFFVVDGETDYTPYVVHPLPDVEPVSEAHCAMHNKGVSQCQEMHGEDDGGFAETVTEFHITVIRLSGDENIHRTGCADIKRAQTRHGIFASEPWDMTVKSWRDYAEQYWGDIAMDSAAVGTPEWLAELESLYTYGTFHACMNGMGIPDGDWQHV